MTKIEWTEKTWNPIIGCSKVSEGCKNCYAEAMSRRLASMNNRISEDYKRVIRGKKFNGEIVYLEERINQIEKWKPSMIFVNSMSDFFHPKVSDEIKIRLLAVMNKTFKHTYQILTKRIELALDFAERHKDLMLWLDDHIWFGVSVESKKYLHRIKLLEMLPAKVRFISFEPLLEDIGEIDLTGINWVIVGGESGHNRRPFNPNWARNILKQCREQNVAFFMKQVDKVREIPKDLLVRDYPKEMNKEYVYSQIKFKKYKE